MARVEIRLTDDEKSNWKQYCHDLGVTESGMMRQLIKSATPDVANTDEFKPARTNKITIRLSDNEIEKLEAQAKGEGYLTSTSWVKAAVVASLKRSATLTETETQALRESNRQLAALGRNLNQIARVLNIEFRESDKITKEMIELLSGQINQHRSKVHQLINQSHHRWELPYEPNL